ncbi:helix-turn-helix domain-containing protein [Brevibacterium oceani]|uniref:helix-turn-helix domain-containing protein n=1 Tax=Brevibacterium oceani TaxID=358099 RepID=UPI0015E638F8|nr:helix-turn-helix transcriptional regulator [Brevibacterium oceani]
MNPLPSDVFARRLRQERERLSISQAELARRMASLLGQNVESTAITRIEQQTRAVRLDEAVTAAMALGVPLIALLSRDAARDNEETIQTTLAELALAKQQWEDQRTEVERLTRLVQRLTGQGDELRSGPTDLDPDLAQAIDDRVPDEDGQQPPTVPGA